MPEEYALETPDSASSLYHSRGADVALYANRPVFTGDVFQLANDQIVCTVQHPCAMRKGVDLVPKLLVCEVTGQSTSVPADWAAGHYKRMFLPELHDEKSYSVEFSGIDVISPESFQTGERVAILSALGVNLLVQRWAYHNNRVVIPTRTINVQTMGPFEEADLVGDACEEFALAGQDVAEALRRVDAWLGNRAGTFTPREQLNDPQARSTVRKVLREQVKEWLDELVTP